MRYNILTEDAVIEVMNDGYEAAEAGRSIDSYSYDAGSERAAAWIAGFEIYFQLRDL